MFKRKLGFLVFIFVFFLSASTVLAFDNENNRPKYVPDEVLVKYKEGQVNLANPGFMSFFRELKTRFSNSLTKDDILETGNIVVYKIKDGRSVEEVINEIKQDTNVEIVQPNYYSYFSDLGTNDTWAANLWGLDNTGQTIDGVAGTNDADIDMPEAWVVSVGTSEVIVAVVDSGVAYEHPDLINNMWDGTNCKDENGNLISGGCLYGYDYGSGDTDPAPVTNYHGTHVTGIIAGEVNNGIGVAGVGQRTKIMALRCENDEGYPTSEYIIKSIDFAIQNGAKVINASFGGPIYRSLEYNAINRFRTAGGLFVASAGNDGKNNDTESHSYPSDYDLDNIISVAATNNRDQLASFSNYGTVSVDVGAPGVDILSTFYVNGVAGYSYLSGTSMAAPFVTGLAGYLLSVDSLATYTEIRDIILNNGDSISSLSETVTGKRINAYNSVLAIAATTPDPTVPGIPTGVGATAGDTEVTLNWTAPVDNGGATIIDYKIYYTDTLTGSTFVDTSVGTTKVITSLTNNQEYSFTVGARNSVGIGSTSASVSATPTAPTVPGIPTGVGATAGDTEVTLNWTAPADNGGASITDYQIEYTTSGVGWTIINDGVSTNTTKNLVSLVNDQEYSFRISAINSVGVGSTSATVTATPMVAPTVPGIPTGVGATAGDTEVTLNWTAPVDNGGATIIDYKIYYTDTLTGSTFVDTSVGTTKVITSLTNNQEYSFTVGARNSVGIGSTSVSVSATPTAPTVPGIPTGVGATAGNAEVTLNWTAPADNGGASITDYQIEYTTSGVGWTTLTTSVGTTKNITSLTNNQLYSFRISARNSVGIGSTSATVSAISVGETGVTTLIDNSVFVIPVGESSTSTPQITVTSSVNINIGDSGTLSQVQLTEDTVITEISDQDFNANLITGASLDESSVSNLLTDYTARALIQWGIPGVTLEFDKPILIKINVGSSYDGQTLNVFRSLSVSSGWTTDGLVSSTCLVVNGICSFSTSQASYFTASTYSGSLTPTPTVTPTLTPTPTPTSAPSSSSSSGPPGPPVCTDQVPLTAPNLFQITAGKGKATLYYAPTNFKTTGYSILYGFTEGDERFGTVTGIMNNNEGVQSLTINDLSVGTYFFKVSANNGCASGPWSKWMSTKIISGTGTATASATGSALPLAGNTVPTVAISLMALTSLAASWVLFKK